MRFSDRYRVTTDSKVKLHRLDPDDTAGWSKGEDVEKALAKNLRKLSDLQYRLYAEGRQSLLIVLQALDAAGKDGTVNHVFHALNPQGCRVVGFKQPSAEEAAHDFLWRVHPHVPRRGEIAIFNRSHYEDVLVVRVHKLAPKAVWSKRYARINDFEKLLAEQGTRIIKFFLHIDKDEQLARFKKRLDDPARHWKISYGDYSERLLWDDYTRAFEDALSKCSTEDAPWFVIPSNHKWFRNLAVSSIVLETLKDMNMKMPPPSVDIEKIRGEYHQAVEGEKPAKR